MKSTLKGITIAITLTLCVISYAAVDTSTQPKTQNNFLQFILRSTSGVITTGNVNNIPVLALSGVDNNVQYFTNRPRRITDSMTTAFFLKRWVKPPPHDFVTNPPNALITYIDKSDRQQFFVAELMKPQYNAALHTLSFTLKLLPGSPPLPTQINRPAIFMAEVTACGLLGAWGNLPGEKQYDLQCHTKQHPKLLSN